MSRWSKAIHHRQNNLYYKITESKGFPEILDAEAADALETDSKKLHNHFFKKGGTWYVQSKVDGSHLFNDPTPGGRGVNVCDSAEYLDYLFKDLKRLA